MGKTQNIKKILRFLIIASKLELGSYSKEKISTLPCLLSSFGKGKLLRNVLYLFLIMDGEKQNDINPDVPMISITEQSKVFVCSSVKVDYLNTSQV